jgi:hypothetical protein
MAGPLGEFVKSNRKWKIEGGEWENVRKEREGLSGAYYP